MDVTNKNTKVLLIGCTGFLGGRLTEILYKKNLYDITVTSNSFSGNGLARAAKYPVKIIHFNMLNKAAIEKSINGFDVVINGSYIKGGKDSTKKSIEGTKNIIEASIKNNVKHFIQISSAAVFEPDQTEIKDETSSFIRKPDDYVNTKLKTEQMVSSLLNSKLNLVTKYTIIRPTRIYGPYSGYWTERILDGLRHNKKVLLEDFKQNPSNFVYVDDVCSAISSSIMNEAAFNNDFNINGERELTWEVLLNGFQDIIDTKKNVQTSSLNRIKSINKDKVRKIFPNAINSLKQALLSNNSLEIFRNDLFLSSIYRTFYGKYRKAQTSLSYEPELNAENLDDYSFLDKYFVKDMIAKTYISSAKIHEQLDLDINFNFEKALIEIDSWNSFFSREEQVIEEMY